MAIVRGTGNTIEASEAGPSPVTIGIPAQRIFVGMVAAAVVLAVAFAATHWLNLQGYSGQLGFRRLFHMDDEANLPAWYSASLLLCAALLLAIIALAKTRHGDPFRWYWWGLAAGFAWLSADESAQLHEMLNRPAHALPFDAAGAFTFPWIALAIPIVATVGVVYLRFLVRLPTATRNRILVAAALYLGAAVGVEMLEGALADAQGLSAQAPDWTAEGKFGLDYMALLIIEETFEMIAIALFIRTLLEYVDTQFARITIMVSD